MVNCASQVLRLLSETAATALCWGLPKSLEMPDDTAPPKHALFFDMGHCTTQARLPLSATPYTLHPTPYTLHPTPYTLHPTPYTLHPTPSILHPTPYTLHPTPNILHPTEREFFIKTYCSESTESSM